MNIYDPTEEPKILRCSQCNRPVAIVRQINGIEMLQIGAFLITSVHGSCDNCGAGLHWNMSEQALSRLVRHVLELRKTEY